MKIIDNIKKELTIASHEAITSRRIPLKDFPLFSEIDASLEIIVRYLEACKADGTIPKINIQDLHKPAPEVVLKKSKRRKAVGEGSSQRTPKPAKKKGNTYFVYVVESIVFPTSKIVPPQPTENLSPQTFEDFDIEFDPSVTLGNLLNEPHSPNPHPKQHQPELARVLSDIELFDQDFSSPVPKNPNTQFQQPKNPQPHSPNPENENPLTP